MPVCKVINPIGSGSCHPWMDLKSAAQRVHLVMQAWWHHTAAPDWDDAPTMITHFEDLPPCTSLDITGLRYNPQSVLRPGCVADLAWQPAKLAGAQWGSPTTGSTSLGWGTVLKVFQHWLHQAPLASPSPMQCATHPAVGGSWWKLNFKDSQGVGLRGSKTVCGIWLRTGWEWTACSQWQGTVMQKPEKARTMCQWEKNNANQVSLWTACDRRVEKEWFRVILVEFGKS